VGKPFQSLRERPLNSPEADCLHNVHIQPRELRVKGVATDGSLQLERKIPGWYILAGGLREYRIDVAKSECMKIRQLTVEVDLEDKPFKETFVVPPGACAR
jgi:hypothetical protein